MTLFAVVPLGLLTMQSLGEAALTQDMNSTEVPEICVTLFESNVMCCAFWKEIAPGMSGSISDDLCPAGEGT